MKKIEKARIMKKKKIPNLTINRLLVSIKVVGSTGPIRFVVNEDETVTNVIDITLRCYARQGRLPIFSSHPTSSFLLYSPYSLNQRETQSIVWFFLILSFAFRSYEWWLQYFNI